MRTKKTTTAPESAKNVATEVTKVTKTALKETAEMKKNTETIEVAEVAVMTEEVTEEVAVAIDEEVTVAIDEEVTIEPEEKIEMSNVTINPTSLTSSNHGVRDILLKDMPITVIKSVKEFDAYTPAQKAAAIQDTDNAKINRVSRETTQKFITAKVRAGNIVIANAAKLTFFTCTKIKKTDADVAAMSNDDKADLVAEYLNKQRAGDEIIGKLISQGMPITAQEVVNITQNRVQIGTLEPIRTNSNKAKSKDLDLSILDDIEFA